MAWLGCGETPEPAPPVQTEAPPLKPLPPPAPRPRGTEGPVDVRLEFDGISRMYRGFFSEPEFTEPLAEALSACFDGWVDVVVAYSNETRKGRVFIQTPGDRLRCRPLVTEHGLDVRPLAPIGQALARYRDTLAGQRDFRLANFRTGIRVVQGVKICDLWTAGQHPPDGTTFSGCVTLQGHEVCAVDDADEGHQRIPWPAPQAADLESCFR